MHLHKIPMALVSLVFMSKMAQILQGGIKGNRKPNDWKLIPWTEDTKLEFQSSLLRHLMDGNYPAVAVNAMILEYHEGRT